MRASTSTSARGVAPFSGQSREIAVCTVRMAPYRVRLYKQGGIHVVHHNETAYLNAISADGSHIGNTHSQINLSHLSKE